MFSFEPSEEQQMFIEAARKFASKELRERARESDEHGELVPSVLTGGWELGLLPASIPEQYGGFGERSAVPGVLAAEEWAGGDLAGALALSAPNLVAFPVLLCGSDQQKTELLPQYCTDAHTPASAALIEPRYDFDSTALKTTAARANSSEEARSPCRAPLPIVATRECGIHENLRCRAERPSSPCSAPAL